MEPNREPAPGDDPLCNYEDIAAEIEHVAEMVRKTPELNHHAAERLLKIAQDIRSDIDRLGRAPHCFGSGPRSSSVAAIPASNRPAPQSAQL